MYSSLHTYTTNSSHSMLSFSLLFCTSSYCSLNHHKVKLLLTLAQWSKFSWALSFISKTFQHSAPTQVWMEIISGKRFSGYLCSHYILHLSQFRGSWWQILRRKFLFQLKYPLCFQLLRRGGCLRYLLYWQSPGEEIKEEDKYILQRDTSNICWEFWCWLYIPIHS